MAIPIRIPIAQSLLGHDKSRPKITESVAVILKRCMTALIADWLTRTKKTPELNHLHLTDEERTGHLTKLVEDLIARLGKAQLPTKDADAVASPSAIDHGKLRNN